MPTPKVKIRKKPTNKRCEKGYPCKTTCISREKNCKEPLKGQAATLNLWLKHQEEMLEITNKKRAKVGLTPARMTEYGYITAERTKLPQPAKVEKAIAVPESSVAVSQPEKTAPKNLPDPKSAIALDELRDMHKRLAAGTITADEIKNNWERFKNSEDAIKAELGKMTIAQIQKEFPQWRQEKKEQYVRGALETIRDRFNPGSSIQYDPFSKDSKAKAHDEVVKKWTDELIAQKVEARRARLDAFKKAIENPETLDEFDTFVQYKGEGKLSPEQLTKYDELRASAGRTQRSRIAEAQKEASKPDVKESASTDSGIDITLHQTKHSKQGHDLHVVKLGDRVERSIYTELNQAAKSLGGYYSAYSRDGAIPGFQFRTIDNAKAFMEKAQAKLGKDVTPINKKGEAIAQPTESTPSEPKANPVSEKLRAMAEKLREQGEEELNRDRLANTHRRAGIAANAIRHAQEKIRFAKTMDNLATAIESNDIKFIDKITTKAAIGQLEGLIAGAKWKSYQKWSKENPNAPYQQRQDQQDRPAVIEDIDNAEYPYPSVNLYDVRRLVEIGKELPGSRIIANRVEKKNESGNNITFKYPSEIDDLRKLATAVKNSKHRDSHWADRAIEEITDYDRLQKAGITNEVELRAALREFMQYRDGADTRLDPIKQAEFNLVGKKFEGYFPTPRGLADRLVKEAGIEPGMKVLEPSAGKGSLLDAIRDRVGDKNIELNAIEPVTQLRDLIKAKGYNVESGDFLQHSGEYDRIVMNPPFEKQQDIDHVRHAFELLKPGGRLVAITSESPFFTQNKKASDFRDFVDTYGISEKLPEGSFKSSDRSTGVATRMVILDKPGVTQKTSETTLNKDSQKIPEPTPEKTTKTTEAELIDRLNKSQSILPINVRYAIDTALDDAFETNSLSSLEIIKDTNTIADGEKVITYTGYGSGDKQFGIGGGTRSYGFAVWDKAKGKARLSDGYQQGKLSTKHSDYYRVTDESESIINTDRLLRKLDKEIDAIAVNSPDLGDKVKAILDQVRTLPNGTAIAENIISELAKEVTPKSAANQKKIDDAIAPLAELANLRTNDTPEQKAVEAKFEQQNAMIGRGAKTYDEIKALAEKTPYDYLNKFSPKRAEEFKQYAERSGQFWKDTRTGHSFKLSEAEKKDLRSLDIARSVLGLPERLTPDGKPKSVTPKPIETPVEGTPRAIAAKETEVQKSDYEFARKSAVPNMGEDLLGSARHIRNQWRSLAEAEQNGSAQELVTRKNLLKNEPLKLMETIDNAHALSHLAAYLSMNAFPPIPFKKEDYDRSTLAQRSGTEVQLREQYYNAFRKIKGIAEDQARLTTDPYAVTRAIFDATGKEIDRLRSETNNYNPVANALISLYKATQPRSHPRYYRDREIGGKLYDFNQRIEKAYGNDGLRNLDQVKEHASRVIEGKSFNESFGTIASKEGQFNAADAYVNVATRTGGRVIDAKTVETGTKFLLDNIGFRGVQYGNSVTDNERVHHLQKSAEALADLADMTGLPDSAISLNGTLGLAIGARGKGNALAHYEPGNKVINLTRKSGIGSLAHEWAHALDNYIAGGGSFVSKQAYGRSLANDPVIQAMREVEEAMTESGFTSRLNAATREKKLSAAKTNYWRSPEEKFARTFERFIQDKLVASGRENTYLAGLSKTIDPLWPNREEIKAIAPAMEKLLAAIREKHFE